MTDAEDGSRRKWWPWVVAVLVVAAVVAAVVLLTTGDDEPDPTASPTPSASPTTGTRSVESWCAAYSPAVVQIQTFSLFPSPGAADELVEALELWESTAPKGIRPQTEKIVAEYTELADLVVAGNEQAVATKAQEMAADPELKQAVSDAARFFGNNCPDGVPPEEQEFLDEGSA